MAKFVHQRRVTLDEITAYVSKKMPGVGEGDVVKALDILGCRTNADGSYPVDELRRLTGAQLARCEKEGCNCGD